jgi:hypothetical protein
MYTPLNKTVFTAAYSGALAGIAAAEKSPTDPVPTDPGVVGSAAVAGAFAESFDAQWGAVVPTTLDVFLIETVALGVFVGNTPPDVPPFTTPSNWNTTTAACIAIVKAGENFFTSEVCN